MRIPRDTVTRINILVISLCVLIGLIFFGLNLYKNLHYSAFTLTVRKDYPLSRSSNGFITSRIAMTSTHNSLDQMSYKNLRTYWWADRTHVYTLGSPGKGLWFRVYSTLKGNFYLIPGDLGSRAAVVKLSVTDKNGQSVNALQPDKWYSVKQYGRGIQLKLSW